MLTRMVSTFQWERFWFGTILILGYLLMVGTCAMIQGVDKQVVHDAMIALGPLVGMVYQSVFKVGQTEQQNANTMQNLASKMPTPPAMKTTTTTTEGTGVDDTITGQAP